LPGTSSCEVCKTIKADEKLNDIPVVFITAAKSDKESRIQAMKCGGEAFLSKPIDNTELTAQILTMVKIKDSNREKRDEKERLSSLVKEKTRELTLTHLSTLNLLEDLKEENETRNISEQELIESEERFRSVTQSAHDAIITTNSKGTIIGWNKGAENIFGYMEKEIIGAELDRITPTPFVNQHTLSFKRLSQGGKPHLIGKTVELEGLKKNGDLFPIELSLAAWETASGMFYTGIIRDITERKAAESALKESETRLSTIFNHSPAGIVLTRMDNGMIVDANTSFANFHGYSRDEIIGHSADELNSWGDQSERDRMIKMLREEGHCRNMEIKARKKTGEYFYMMISVELIDLSGEQFMLGLVDDITERKLTEQALKESERRFFTIFHSIPIPVTLSDLTTDKWVEINPAFLTLTGYDREEVIGKSFLNIHLWKNIEDRKRMREVLNAQGNIKDFEFEILKKTGETCAMLISAEKVDLSGKPYLLIMGMDITERKRNEAELQFRNILLTTQQEVSIDGILIVDENLNILSYNKRFVEMWNVPLKLINSKDDNAVMQSANDKIANPEAFYQRIQYINEHKQETSYDELVLKDGRFFERHSAPMIGLDDQYLGRVWNFRDITERRKTEAMLIHADRMASLGEMAAGIAHEINQPLNILSLVMDSILFEGTKSGTLDIGYFKDKSDKIFDNITRIRNIIDHIRAFSRSNDDYILTAFDINASIENAVSMISDQLKHDQISIGLYLENQLPQINGNTYKFEQVVINLLTNAKDALIEKKNKEKDFFEMKIGIKSYQENKAIIVEVTDNGSGIAKEEIDKVMLPFYTTKDPGKGTGLGLSICYSIIKEMNGILEISSNPVNGTTVKIILDIKNKVK
jgi:PAS domain S-box-containing protein